MTIGSTTSGGRQLRAGVSAIDVSPETLPVIVSGSFFEKTSSVILDPLHARSLVLDDGDTRLAITVVDIGMMPRELVDEAKALASRETGVPVERMVVAATHTHAAPATMGALGSREDRSYSVGLPAKIAAAIVTAAARLEPAEIGWGFVDDWDHTNCRRWITHPDKMLEDPFGERSVRAMMHPGYLNPDYVTPSGPVDPQLAVVALRRPGGAALAVLANYGMHYFGTPGVSADYYGRFAGTLGARLGAGDGAFVAMMCQGPSGDQHWMDYGQPKREGYTIDQYAAEMVNTVARVYEAMAFRPWVPVKMVETRLTVPRRVPDAARLAWAEAVVANLADGVPTTRPEVFAKEQLLLAAEPERELRLQAIALGELGIRVMPTEAFGLSGLRMRAESPVPESFTITLANGAEGYVPPAEQYRFGGYVTWPARTAGLAVSAEATITSSLTTLLERVTGATRRTPSDEVGSYARAVLDREPMGYWRLHEFGGTVAADTSGHGRDGVYDGRIAFHLTGAETEPNGGSSRPQLPSPFSGARVNRAAYFAGGTLRLPCDSAQPCWSLAFWLWNGLADAAPSSDRWLLATGESGKGLALGISGSAESPNHLRLRLDASVATSRAPLSPRVWHHVVVVRDGSLLRVHVNGGGEAWLTATVPARLDETMIVLGSAVPGEPGFEGKLDEVSLHATAFGPDAVAALWQAAQGPCLESAV